MKRQRRRLFRFHSLRPVFTAVIMSGLAGMLLVGCARQGPPPAAAGPATPPAPTPSAYQARMRQLGYTELVGDDLAAVPLPPNPSQADQGLEPYRQICLACHGDWGQGLTDEWRQEWGDDANCWQSKCHASNHPDWGFELPAVVPPLLGPGSLNRYANAAELQQTIAQNMPWWNPNSLTQEQAWALTAFLMRTRGEIDDRVTLTADNAAVYRLHVPYAPPQDGPAGPILLLSLLLLMLVTQVRRAHG